MKVTILGCGAYGLALATQLNQKNEVYVYTPFFEEKEEIQTKGTREKALPGIDLSSLKVTTSKEEALTNADFVIFAVPFSKVEDTLLEIRPFLKETMYLVLASKGLTEEGLVGIQLFKNHHISNPLLVLSGPTFALDVAHSNPVIVTIASSNKQDFLHFSSCLPTSILKEYTNDLEGVSYCAAFKTVFSILQGYLVGKGASTSTQAAFLYQGFLQLQKFLEEENASSKTAFTAAGIADFYMSCESCESRNFTVGKMLASKKVEEVEKYLKINTVEGIYNLRAIQNLMKNKRKTLPVFDLLEEILQGKSYSIHEMIESISL